jgi:hypothetical protein
MRQTAQLVQDTMGLTCLARKGNRFRYQAGGRRGIDRRRPLHPDGLIRPAGSAGTVHHIAWRTPRPDDQTGFVWRERPRDTSDHNVSPVWIRSDLPTQSITVSRAACCSKSPPILRGSRLTSPRASR